MDTVLVGNVEGDKMRNPEPDHEERPQLIYAIYLDIEMMSGFLASLTGGIVEETSIENKSIDSTEQTRRAAISGQLLNKLIGGIQAEGGLDKKIQESLEGNYKSTIRFPSASLFFTLRSELQNEGLVKRVVSRDDINDIDVGDIIEAHGLARPSPDYQLRQTYSQMMLLGPFLKIGQLAQDSDSTVSRQSNQQKVERGKPKKDTANKSNENQLQMVGELTELFGQLFPPESADVIIFSENGVHFICRVYLAFIREERIQDIHDARWHCIGKVIEKIPEGQEHKLLKGQLVEGLAKDQDVKLTDRVITGPAFVVATLAIFA
jgi:hypothetical protein